MLRLVSEIPSLFFVNLTPVSCFFDFPLPVSGTSFVLIYQVESPRKQFSTVCGKPVCSTLSVTQHPQFLCGKCESWYLHDVVDWCLI